jgi:AcrR family transcriptional regulator
MSDTRRPNARSAQTRRKLQAAVLVLAERHDFSEIDVLAVTRQADLNRSTFYLHYPDKEALISEVLDGLLENLTETGRMLRAVRNPEIERSRKDWQDSLFTLIAQRPVLFRRLLRQGGPDSFSERLRVHNEEALMTLWQRLGYSPPPDGAPMHVGARFAAAGLQGMILQWLESGMAESPDTLSRWIWNLCFPNHQVHPPSDLGTA